MNKTKNNGKKAAFNAAHTIDNAFDIYRNSFLEQFTISLVINTIYIFFLGLVIWLGTFKILPAIAAASDNATLSGILSLFTIGCISVVVIAFFQGMVSCGAVAVSDDYIYNDQQGFGALFFSVVKGAWRIFTVVLAQFIVCFPIALSLLFIVYKTLNLSSIVGILTLSNIEAGKMIPAIASFLFCFFIYIFIKSIFSCSITMSFTEKRYFFPALAQSFKYVTNPERLFKILGTTSLWSIVSVLFFIMIYTIIKNIIPPLDFLAKMPYGTYAYPVYYFVLTYMITIVTAPVSRIINYSIYTQVTVDKWNNAGLGSRTAAAILDLIIYTIVFAAVSLLSIIFSVGLVNGASLKNMPLYGWIVLTSAYMVSLLIYHIFFETMFNGQTPGKMILGLRVTSDNGQKVTFIQSLLRNIFRLIDIFAIGAIMILVREDKTRAGDLLSKAEVINIKI